MECREGIRTEARRHPIINEMPRPAKTGLSKGLSNLPTLKKGFKCQRAETCRQPLTITEPTRFSSLHSTAASARQAAFDQQREHWLPLWICGINGGLNQMALHEGALYHAHCQGQREAQESFAPIATGQCFRALSSLQRKLNGFERSSCQVCGVDPTISPRGIYKGAGGVAPLVPIFGEASKAFSLGA
jgi:hypothetical protein